MSSYTLSAAELEAQRKAALEAELERQRKELAEATIEYTEVRGKVSSLISNIEVDHHVEIAMASHKDELELMLEEIRHIKTLYIQQLKEVQKAFMPSEASDIRDMNERIRKNAHELYRKYQEAVKELYERLDSNVAADIRLAQINEISKTYAGAKTELGYVEISIEYMEAQESVRAMAEGVVKEITSIARNDNVLSEDKTRLENIKSKIVECLECTENIYSSLETLLFEYKSIRRLALIHGEMVITTYEQYLSEYIIYMNLLNSDREEKLPITPLEKSEFLSFDALKNEVAKIKTKSRTHVERHYIAEQIRQVMEQYGYRFCEDIYIDDAEHTEYICVDGDRTGVKVNVGHNGEVMMEVMLNEQDDEAEGIEDMDDIVFEDGEAEELENKQKEFCMLREDIIDELALRGVVFRDKSVLCPGKHMKKIRTNSYATKGKATSKSTSRARATNSENIAQLKVK